MVVERSETRPEQDDPVGRQAVQPALEPRQQASSGPDRACYFVLGMHRSGTSSLAGALVKLGVAAPAHLLGANRGNEAGHWESAPLIAFHDELLASAGSRWDDWREIRPDWYGTPVAANFKARANQLLDEEFGDAPLFVFKDPRNCRLMRFWLEIFAERGIAPKIVLPVRSPLEVAQSHRARDGFPLRKGLLLWLRHVLDAEAASRDLPRVVVEYEAFLKDWQSGVAAMEQALGAFPGNTDLAAAEIDRFLRDDLKHQRIAPEELARNALIHDWVEQAYAAMLELVRNPGSNSARASLDDIRDRFNVASTLFGGVLADAESSLSEIEQRLREAEQARNDALAQLTAAQQERDAQAAEAARLAAVNAEVLAQLAAAQQGIERQRDEHRTKIALLISENSDQRRTVDGLLSSTSWKLTKPLRSVKTTTKKLRRYLFQAAYKIYKRLPLPLHVRARLSQQFRPLLLGVIGPSTFIKNQTLISNVFNKSSPTYLQEPASLQEDRSFLRIFRCIEEHISRHGRLSHVYAVPFLARGGSELVLSYYVKYLDQAVGGSVVVLVTDRMLADSSWNFPDNVLVIDLFDFFPSSSREQRSRVIFRIIGAVNCDVFHIVNSDASWALLRDYGERLGKLSRVFASCFCLQFEKGTGKRVGYSEYYVADCLPFLSGLLTDNRRFVDDVTQLYMNGNDFSQKLYPIYNPVRELDIKPDTGRVFAANNVSVLWAGRLDEQKRVDLLLAVAQHVRDVHFHIFGKAVVDDDDGIVERLGKLDNVTLHGGFSQLSELLAAGPYNAFISTSKYEGMPNMLLEIGLVGIPIIAPAVGGIPELIYDQTGYLLPADPSPQDYSTALAAISKAPNEAARRSASLQNLLADRHCWSSFVEAMAEIDGYLP